jgi:pimeloyl-ACP methyl ester carboxylesterase
MSFYHQLLASLILAAPPLLVQVGDRTGLKSRYAPIHGLKMYYEIHAGQTHGSEVPLILLHGGIMSTDSFTGMIPSLSANREVIAVDLQAHGRTADIDRPLSYESMADDIAALIEYLHIQKADVMGYSLGGGVALRTAIQHPELVRKLVLVSTTLKRDGWYPEIQEAMSKPMPAQLMKQSPIYQTYASVAPRPQDWELLLTKLQHLVSKEYDWTSQAQAIKAPTLLVFGDADAVRPAHVVEFFNLLGGGKRDAGWDGSAMPDSRLAILPATTHYNIIASSILPSITTQFLDAPMPTKK